MIFQIKNVKTLAFFNFNDYQFSYSIKQLIVIHFVQIKVIQVVAAHFVPRQRNVFK